MQFALLKWLLELLLSEILTDENKRLIVEKASEAAAQTENEFDDFAVLILARVLGVS